MTRSQLGIDHDHHHNHSSKRHDITRHRHKDSWHWEEADQDPATKMGSAVEVMVPAPANLHLWTQVDPRMEGSRLQLLRRLVHNHHKRHRRCIDNSRIKSDGMRTDPKYNRLMRMRAVPMEVYLAMSAMMMMDLRHSHGIHSRVMMAYPIMTFGRVVVHRRG